MEGAAGGSYLLSRWREFILVRGRGLSNYIEARQGGLTSGA